MSPIRICLISVYCLVLCLARTQSVYISPEINVKNDFSYYLLYHPDGTTSLLRDKSFKLILQTLYPDFTLSQEKTIDIPGKKWRIIEIYERQNHIGIFYLNKQESEYFMYYSEYNSQGILQSEKKLYASKELLNNENLKIISSADQNWMSISFYNLNHEKQLILYNRREDSIYYSINLEKILTGESKKFHFFEVSNKGGVYVWQNQ
jgi:hypothetical protein